jgi:hypothetical protein
MVPRAKRRRRPDTGNMAINASDWCERHHVWWTDKAEDKQFPDTEYRMKIMENGMLLFQHKELGENYVCAPHTWRRVSTRGVDPTE